jgi:hypothetical protein
MRRFTQLTGIHAPLWPKGEANKLVARFAQMRLARPPQVWIEWNVTHEWHMRFTLMWVDWMATTLPKDLDPEVIVARINHFFFYCFLFK